MKRPSTPPISAIRETNENASASFIIGTESLENIGTNEVVSGYGNTTGSSSAI